MNSIRFVAILFTLSLAACNEPAPYASRAVEIFPAMEIKQAALFRMDELGITQDFFKGAWTAVAFASAECPLDCQHRLALLDQAGDAKALLVITDLARHDQMRGLKKNYPNVEISMGATAASLDMFIEQFNDSAIGKDERAGYIYLVNPSGILTHALAATEVRPGHIARELEVLARSGN